MGLTTGMIESKTQLMCPWGKIWFGDALTRSSVVYKIEVGCRGCWLEPQRKLILGEEAPLSALALPHVPTGAFAEHPAMFTMGMKSALQGEHLCVVVVRAMVTRAKMSCLTDSSVDRGSQVLWGLMLSLQPELIWKNQDGRS